MRAATDLFTGEHSASAGSRISAPKTRSGDDPGICKGGDPFVIPSPGFEKEERPLAAAPAESAPVKQEPAADVKVATPAKRTANKKALRSKPEATTA